MQQHHRIARSIADDRQREWQRAATSDRQLRALDDGARPGIQVLTAPPPTFRPRPAVMSRLTGLFRLGARA